MVLYYDYKLMSSTIFNVCLFCREKPKAPPIEEPDVTCYKTDTNLGECIICYEEMKVGRCVLLVSCGHAYHPWCLNAWFLRKELCPICQVPLKI